MFFLGLTSLWLWLLRTRKDLLRLSRMWDTVRLLLSRYPKPSLLLLFWMSATLTQPPTSLITSSSLSRQFSLADLLLLQTSRLLWLRFRFVTLSLRLLHLSWPRLLVTAMLGMEMVSVKARVRRRNLCLAVFFSIFITVNVRAAHTWPTREWQNNLISFRAHFGKKTLPRTRPGAPYAPCTTPWPCKLCTHPLWCDVHPGRVF